jgi:hypothetical protein
MGTTIQIITIIALLLSPTFGADTSIEIPISPSPVGLPLIDITATPSSYSTLSSIFDTPYLFNYLYLKNFYTCCLSFNLIFSSFICSSFEITPFLTAKSLVSFENTSRYLFNPD